MKFLINLFLLIPVFGGAAYAQATAFEVRAERSIDRGVDWLAANGAFSDPSSAGRAAGLVALVLLDHPRRLGPSRGDSLGNFLNRARLGRVMNYLLRTRTITSTNGAAGVTAMALARYLQSGGQDPRAAPRLAQLLNQFEARQGLTGTVRGYWCYVQPACANMPMTNLVVAGLGAMRSLYLQGPHANAARATRVQQLLDRSADALPYTGSNDFAGRLGSGFGYQPDGPRSLQSTAAALSVQLIAGTRPNDSAVQGPLRWVRNHYRYAAPAADVWPRSHALSLWTSARALLLLEAWGSASDWPRDAVLDASDLGRLPTTSWPANWAREVNRVPALIPCVSPFRCSFRDAEPEHEPGWYFDYAASLIDSQDATGRYVSPNGVWNAYAAQAYALLVISRSTAGAVLPQWPRSPLRNR